MRTNSELYAILMKNEKLIDSEDEAIAHQPQGLDSLDAALAEPGIGEASRAAQLHNWRLFGRLSTASCP